MIKSYKVKFTTMLEYWKSKPYRSIIVEAETETDAYLFVLEQFKNHTTRLSEQVYNIEVSEVLQ